MKVFLITSLIGLSSLVTLSGATDSQHITLDGKMQIPGATLKSGEYIFSVEDRLQDRAIVRIADVKGKSHDLLLAIPSEKLSASGSGQLIVFPNGDSDKKVLQGWMCGSCKVPLEFVYPKAEAVKITGVSAKPVLAVDPTYDKLPKNLSQDDMKVVTLWLLSPKEITPDQKGKGVEAAKVADLNKQTETASASHAGSAPAPVAGSEVAANSQPPASPSPDPAPAAAAAPAPASVAQPAPVASATPEATAAAPVAVPAPTLSASAPTASVSAPTTSASAPTASASAPTPSAAAEQPVALVQTASAPASAMPPAHARRMPHTASNTYGFGIAGLLLLAGGLGLRSQRNLRSLPAR